MEFFLAIAIQTRMWSCARRRDARAGPETSRLSYSIDAVAEFEDFVEDMYDFAEAQALNVDTLIHENGTAQMEINFEHGDALALADQGLRVQAHGA